MAFRVEIKVINDNTWYSNGLVFATDKEAEAYGRHKHSTWFASAEWRVVESDKEVNYKINLETREMSEV